MAPPEAANCVACAGANPAAVEPSNDKLAPSPYEVHVSAVSKGLKSELQAAEHSLALDAGHSLGGQQSAPSPVQAFIASIVACTQITLQIVAKEHGVELPDIQWTGWGVFDTRRLAAGANTDPRFQTIKVDGKLVGGSSISQATLDELAAGTSSRCPISQSLHPNINYQLTLAAEA